MRGFHYSIRGDFSGIQLFVEIFCPLLHMMHWDFILLPAMVKQGLQEIIPQ